MMAHSSMNQHHSCCNCAVAGSSARINLIVDTALLAVSIFVILCSVLIAPCMT